jgi:hypothetical protein
MSIWLVAARRYRCMPLRAHHRGTPLKITSLIHDEDHAGISGVLLYVTAQVIPHPGLIPHRL